MKIYPVQTHYTNSNYPYGQTFNGKNFAKVLESIDYKHDYDSEKWFNYFKMCMKKVQLEPKFRKIGDLFDKFANIKSCEELEGFLNPNETTLVSFPLGRECIARDKYGDLIIVSYKSDDGAYRQCIEFVSEGKKAVFGIQAQYTSHDVYSFHYAEDVNGGVIFG